jgi:hypothetical protein
MATLLAAIIMTSVSYFIALLRSAPEGYQDRSGFHFVYQTVR